MMENIKKLHKILGKAARLDEPLGNHTFLKIGGPADVYLEADSAEILIKAITSARGLNVNVTILGHGSNVLISDSGIRGLVLVNKSSDIEVLDKEKADNNYNKIQARWESDSKKGTFKYEFKDLDYDESNKERISVRMDSGVELSKALNSLIDRGITGLQWYAGIPGTIGGAVFNNIHGGTHFLSEVIEKVRVMGKDNSTYEISIDDLGVGYDKSRFQTSEEIVLDATFKLYLGDRAKAKYVATEWAKRKSVQPRNSPGCAFHNLTQEQKEKLDLPTTSAGYVIEHLLKLTGFSVGDAGISTQHHNFIVNKGRATADEYLFVMKEIYTRAKVEFGIELVSEIFLLGFNDDEINEFRAPEQVHVRKKRNDEIRTVYNDSKKLFDKKKR